MSKINSCYPLCPLIDQKSFFGVSDDCESGYVVVTLGKNMVVRYKLSDQKQVNSWNTKVRLSSPVIFDRSSKQYVGVFNSNTIQMWNEHNFDLNKVKKYKFKDNIHCVLSNNNSTEADNVSPVIVFKNGRIAPLTSRTLENRKDVEELCCGTKLLVVDGNGNSIEDAHLLTSGRNTIIVLVCTSFGSVQKTMVCHLLPLKSDLFQPVSFKLQYQCRSEYLSEVNVNHEDDNIKLTGYAFINGEPLKLITSWTDGSLYCLDFSPSDSDLQDINVRFPGEKIMDVKVINTKLKVALLPLDNVGCHIAIYGSDPSEEGALITIINIKHKVIQCKYHIKLYCTSPKLWCGGPTDLLLVVGQHLAVAHYRLVSQKLAALVGTQIDSTSSTNVLLTKWCNQILEEEKRSEFVVCDGSKASSSSNDLLYEDDSILFIDEDQINHTKNSVESLFNEGLSEAGICDRLVPTFVETRDTLSLNWLLNKFNDLPFHCILLIIGYCLKKLAGNEFFEHSLDDSDSDREVEEEEDDHDAVNKITGATIPSPDNDRTKTNDDVKRLLFYALTKSILPDNKALLLVRSELPLTSVLSLMNYLIDFMIEYPSNMRLIDWAILVLDSYYQSFIISKDNTMIKTFKRLNNWVKTEMAFMSTWEDLSRLIKMIKSGNKSPPKSITNIRSYDCLYSLDKLSLY